MSNAKNKKNWIIDKVCKNTWHNEGNEVNFEVTYVHIMKKIL